MASLASPVSGLGPVAYFPGDQPFDMVKRVHIRAENRTAKEILRQEPYLALSVLFLFFKAFAYVSPEIWSQLKALWLSYVWHANWAAIFGGWSHLLKRALHAVDLKRLWSKLTISKRRNFQKGACNARAWASSLTSVSLGESGSSRSISSSSWCGSSDTPFCGCKLRSLGEERWNQSSIRCEIMENHKPSSSGE